MSPPPVHSRMYSFSCPATRHPSTGIWCVSIDFQTTAFSCFHFTQHPKFSRFGIVLTWYLRFIHLKSVFKIKHWKHVLIMYLLWYERVIHINVLSYPVSLQSSFPQSHYDAVQLMVLCLLTATSTARLRWDFSSVLPIWERKLTWMKLRDFTRSLFSGSGPRSHTSPLCPPIWSCLMFWKR